MFDYLFVSYENREDYSYRHIGQDPNKTSTTGVSEPTYYARVSYVSEAHIVDTLIRVKELGVNLIRVAVEPAIMKATSPYVDPTDGLTYPADLTMLDIIITHATEMGIVTQLQNGNDKAPIPLNLEFIKFLADRYSTNAYIWINPANELNGANGSGNVNNISVWHETMSQYLTKLREPSLTGLRFLNPVVINPPQFGENLVGIFNILNAYAVYNTDPCLVIGVHLYPQKGQYDFKTTRLPAETENWFKFVDNFCIFVDEVGINNYGTSYDPDLNPGYASADADEWVRMKSWTIDFCDWLYRQCNYGLLNGATGISWYAYIPGMSIVDLNSMVKYDQDLSHWGEIFTSYTSKADVLTPTPADSEWNVYIPVVSAAYGTIGSYTATGRFYRLNAKTRLIEVTIMLPNNGTAGGALYVTLPASEGKPAYASHSLSGIQIVNDYSLVVRATQGSNTLKIKRYDGTYPGGSGSQLIISGFYEIL